MRVWKQRNTFLRKKHLTAKHDPLSFQTLSLPLPNPKPPFSFSFPATRGKRRPSGEKYDALNRV